MKKIKYYILIITIGIGFHSCSDDDILDKPPLDVISDAQFWTSESDLELYLNKLYNRFGGWSSVGTGFSSIPDNGSDVALYTFQSDRLNGANNIPTAASPPEGNGSNGQIWQWNNIRNVNYFLENVNRVTEGPLLNHYIGEGYFFRAMFYFNNLMRYGDLPIIDKLIADDDDDVLYASRNSRTEVVNFILSDLDNAISKLKSKSGIPSYRINVDIALLLKARISLYEGTWEKYHAGSEFAGDTDGSNFLQQAAAAAKAVIDNGNYALKMGDPAKVYYELFNQTSYSGNSEIMFFKQYDFLTYGNSFGNDLQRGWPNRSGITREQVRSYLCTDGLPISLSPLYQGDASLAEGVINRDPRCDQSIMIPGDVVTDNAGVLTYYTAPELTGNNFCPTGYEWEKFRRPSIDSNTGDPSKNVAFIHYRFAEALLIYAEAKAELGSITQSDLDISINKLRDRVSMPHLTLGSIFTDSDWPDYGYSLSDVLYEIRRERQVEMLGEGKRFNDLMRWRAHNLITGQSPKGAKYTALLKSVNPSLAEDADGYLDPYQGNLQGSNGGYGFDPNRDYLQALPSNELVINTNLVQNPGW